MRRVLVIRATNGGTTAKVRIEVDCSETCGWDHRREHAARVLHNIASGVMEAIRAADYFRVPLSRQRIGR